MLSNLYNRYIYNPIKKMTTDVVTPIKSEIQNYSNLMSTMIIATFINSIIVIMATTSFWMGLLMSLLTLVGFHIQFRNGDDDSKTKDDLEELETIKENDDNTGLD